MGQISRLCQGCHWRTCVRRHNHGGLACLQGQVRQERPGRPDHADILHRQERIQGRGNGHCVHPGSRGRNGPGFIGEREQGDIQKLGEDFGKGGHAVQVYGDTGNEPEFLHTHLPAAEAPQHRERPSGEDVRSPASACGK